MKLNIHPTYYEDCVVTCSCGHTFTTGSTKQKMKVDICSVCHPFYTGQQKFVDTVGNIDRFRAKMEAATLNKQKMQVKKEETERKERAPKSLREMLLAVKGK